MPVPGLRISIRISAARANSIAAAHGAQVDLALQPQFDGGPRRGSPWYVMYKGPMPTISCFVACRSNAIRASVGDMPQTIVDHLYKRAAGILEYYRY